MKSLRFKILGGVGSVLILLIIVSIQSFSTISTFSDHVDQMVNMDVKLTIADLELSSNIQKRIALVRGYMLFKDRAYKDSFLETTKESKAIQDQVLSLSQSDTAKSLINKSVEWRKIITDQLFPKFEQGDIEGAMQLLEKEVTQIGREIDNGFSDLASSRVEKTQTDGVAIQAQGDHDKIVIMALAGAALILGIIVAFIIAHIIVKPIKQIVERIKDIAQGEGDLTVRVESKSKDEIGELAQWFNTFVEKIQDIITKIKDSSEQVGNATEQISAASEQLATGAEEQQYQLSEVSTAVEQMSAMILESSKSTSMTQESANNANSSAQQGREAVVRAL